MESEPGLEVPMNSIPIRTGAAAAIAVLLLATFPAIASAVGLYWTNSRRMRAGPLAGRSDGCSEFAVCGLWGEVLVEHARLVPVVAFPAGVTEPVDDKQVDVMPPDRAKRPHSYTFTYSRRRSRQPGPVARLLSTRSLEDDSLQPAEQPRGSGRVQQA
jgi:hypothetical protein